MVAKHVFVTAVSYPVTKRVVFTKKHTTNPERATQQQTNVNFAHAKRASNSHVKGPQHAPLTARMKESAGQQAKHSPTKTAAINAHVTEAPSHAQTL